MIDSEHALWKNGEISGGTENWTFQYPHIFETIPIPSGKILDIGSHDLRFARWLKSQGIDRDIVSLDVRDIGHPEGKFVRASARKLPFTDNAFDTSISFFAVPMLIGHKVPEAETIQEMIRISSDQIIIWPVPGWWMGLSSWISPETEQNNSIMEYAQRMVKNSQLDIKVITIKNEKTHWMNKILVIKKEKSEKS